MPGPSTSLKRKPDDDYDDEFEALDRPSKLPAIGEGGPKRPLQSSRTALNLTSNSKLLGKGPPPLTQPKAPSFASSSTSRRGTRATSAPPSKSTTTTRSNSAASNRGAPNARPTAGRVASGSAPRAPSGTDDKRFQALSDQLSSLEHARLTDAARLSHEMSLERQKVSELQSNHLALSRELAAAKSAELSHQRKLDAFDDEVSELKKQHRREVEELEGEARRKERECRELKEDLRVCREDLERERLSVSQLKATISHQSTAHLGLTTQNNALQAQVHAIQSSLDLAHETISQLKLDLETAERKKGELEREVLEAEGVRRKLHNMVQELKGNIRVFCRVRPVLPSDISAASSSTSSRSSTPNGVAPPSPSPEDLGRIRAEVQASIEFPDKRDHKEIVLSSVSESATGQERQELWGFNFDRVFEPTSTQVEVFEEISHLAQSCVDGYNVCIFAYGQTGSGKSWTMEGGSTDATAGMIPRAVEQVFRAAEGLKHKGWEYTMEGQFLEIYNETINDLLGKHEFDKKKHEIKHDPKTHQTSITETTTIPLPSPTRVRSLLSLAASRRSVASTLMNERSSRSHSIFILRITGKNAKTGEESRGSLNLVDLAGSERLKESGVLGDRERLKETVNINRSLSALGDVVAALGEKSEKGEKHIPYRNSKLTYLLQNSLSGNSKTLMILNVSPLAAHLNESLCSLRFATKVNNTTIGTAKKQIKSS